MAKLSYSNLMTLFLFISLASFPFNSARNINQHIQTVSVDQLGQPRECNAGKGSKGKTTLKLVDRHGPCSPFHQKAGAAEEGNRESQELLEQDQLRVDWIHSRTAAPSTTPKKKIEDLLLPESTTELPANPGSSFGSRNFIVSVGLGTPKKDFSLVFDTGSDLSWVQCDPCLVSCYQQQGPRFSPSASSTYKYVPCLAAECAEAKLESGLNGCSASRCIYGITYGDKSMSVGLLGQDTLTLTPNDVVPGFTFGCGHRNQGLFGTTGGMFGLGRSKLSVPSQTTGKFGGVFAYCLPTAGLPGSLEFGPDPSYSTAQYTPLLTGSQSYYYITITGISVGGQLLPVSSSVFATSGTIIDSGTVITRLPPTVYSALRSAFRTFMAQYPLLQPSLILDTCYDLSKYPTIQYPVIRFHFEGGVDVPLDASNIFFVPSTTQACLAFAPTDSDTSLSIFGNRQQRKILVVHDAPNARIGFKPAACS
ncbi:unnamed protein product [Victoria cruziana]